MKKLEDNPTTNAMVRTTTATTILLAGAKKTYWLAALGTPSERNRGMIAPAVLENRPRAMFKPERHQRAW
jgi:hypothetical protein